MLSKEKFKRIIWKLEREIRVEQWHINYDSFELLVSTILSQATNSRNVVKAFKSLKDKFNVNPSTLAKASVEQISECIRPAGLHNVKAMKIKALSEKIMEDHDGSLDRILELPLDEAREKLMDLPGVGSKTADVMLCFAKAQPVIPIDTHIERISKRLKIVEEKAGYMDIKRKLEQLTPKSKRTYVHLLLIQFGRRYCRARNPKCRGCPIQEHCEWELKKFYLKSK